MKLLKNCIMLLVCAMVMFTSIAPCYSGSGDFVADSGSSGLAEVGEKVVSTASAGEDMLVKICLALFPISLLVLIILMLFTKNDKKFAGYMWFAGAVCLCTLAVLLVENGTALHLLEKFADAIKL